MYQYLLNKFYTLDYEDVKDTFDFKLIAELQRYLQEPPKSSSTKETMEEYYRKRDIISIYYQDCEWIPKSPSFSPGELWVIYDLIHDLPKHSNIDLEHWDIPKLVRLVVLGYRTHANMSTLHCIYGICEVLDVFCTIPEPIGYKNRNKKKESETNASTKK